MKRLAGLFIIIILMSVCSGCWWGWGPDRGGREGGGYDRGGSHEGGGSHEERR